MDETYEIGVKRRYSYSVNVPKRNYDQSENRHNLIISIVEQNPDILHTHVIQLALKIGKVPKVIVENKLRELKEEEILIDKKEGDPESNGLRTWRIFTNEEDWEKEAIKGINLLLKYNNELKKFVVFDNKDNIFHKNLQTTYLIKLIAQLLSILYIFPQKEKSKHIMNKTKDLQKMLDGIYANISKDNSQNTFQIINLLKKDCEIDLKQFLKLNSV